MWPAARPECHAGGDTHLRAAITTAGKPDLLAQFPFSFRLSATYTLSGRTLGLEVKATNLGQSPMPFGRGVHPYFPAPLVPGGRLEDEIVRSDVTCRPLRRRRRLAARRGPPTRRGGCQ